MKKILKTKFSKGEKNYLLSKIPDAIDVDFAFGNFIGVWDPKGDRFYVDLTKTESKTKCSYTSFELEGDFVLMENDCDDGAPELALLSADLSKKSPVFEKSDFFSDTLRILEDYEGSRFLFNQDTFSCLGLGPNDPKITDLDSGYLEVSYPNDNDDRFFINLSLFVKSDILLYKMVKVVNGEVRIYSEKGSYAKVIFPDKENGVKAGVSSYRFE